jgi:hypothetical protein
MAWHTLLSRGEELHIGEHTLTLRQYIGARRAMYALDGVLHTALLPCDVELDDAALTLAADGKGRALSVAVIAPPHVKIEKTTP